MQSDEGMKVRLEVGDALEGASEEGVFKIIQLKVCKWTIHEGRPHLEERGRG